MNECTLHFLFKVDLFVCLFVCLFPRHCLLDLTAMVDVVLFVPRAFHVSVLLLHRDTIALLGNRYFI